MILDTMTTIRMRTTKGLFTRLGTWSSWSSCSSSLSQYVAFVFVIVWLCSKHIKLFEQLTHVYWDGLSFILPLVQQHPCTSSKLETAGTPPESNKPLTLVATTHPPIATIQPPNKQNHTTSAGKTIHTIHTYIHYITLHYITLHNIT